MRHQLVIVLDFGGQYDQLIARRVRDQGVYCEVKSYTTPLAELRAMEPIGVIFTGGGGRRRHQEPPQRGRPARPCGVLRRSWSPCACYSRTRCAGWAGSWACRRRWCRVSPSPGRGWPSG